jgi:hypothetical protein
MEGSPPPIQVINDRTGRGVSDRGSGKPWAEVTRLRRPTERARRLSRVTSPGEARIRFAILVRQDNNASVGSLKS